MRGNNYGQTRKWNETAAHNWRAIGFPRGILLLEAQQRLMSLLRGVVGKLLEGLVRVDTKSRSDHFTKTRQCGLKRCSDSASSISNEFASVYLHQSFSAPPAFDIKGLLSSAQIQLNMWGDHLWLLQTEPSYMRRYGMLLMQGSHGENLTKTNQNIFITQEMMKDAIWYWSWEWILEEARKLCKVQEELKVTLGSGGHLPERYERAIGSLQAFLRHQLKFRAIDISFILPSRPGFQSSWKIYYKQRLQSTLITRQRADLGITHFDLFFKDRLEYCLTRLMILPHLKECFDLMVQHEYARVFAILDEHLSEMSKKGKTAELARLDEVLYNKYSDLSAVHQMLAMVQLHRPHPQEQDVEEIRASETGRGWQYVRKQFFEQSLERSGEYGPDGEWINDWKIEKREDEDSKIKAEQHLSNLLKDFLATPSPKGSQFTQTWIDQDKAERAALDRFWEGMRERHRETLLRLEFGLEDIESDLKILSSACRPDHLEALEVEREGILAEIAARSAAKEAKNLKNASLSIQTQWGSDNQKEIETLEPKVKVKTRATTESKESSTGSASDIVEDDKPEPLRVAVSRGAFYVFQAMFPSPGNEYGTRVVKWSAFVNAMAEGEVGFVARHDGGGSAFTFEPN
jgi:hypothetical protein